MAKIEILCSYLCWVDLSLDDVEDGDVAVARLPLSACGHHHILGLQKPPHHIQHCGFPDASNLKRVFSDLEVNMANVKNILRYLNFFHTSACQFLDLDVFNLTTSCLNSPTGQL